MKELLNTGINLPLEYDAGTDALIGQVKGYSVAVKENLATSSYGCLFWIRTGDFTAITTAEEYLADKQKADPEFIKKFMVAETGAAVALNRTADDFTNVNNLKRFIFDFTASLSLNFYKNCCCECGRTDDLSLYSTEGTIAQACSQCGAKYQFLKSVECEASAVPAVPVEPVQTESAGSETKEESQPEISVPDVPEMPVVEKLPDAVTGTDELLVPADETAAISENNESSDDSSLLTPVEETVNIEKDNSADVDELLVPADETAAISENNESSDDSSLLTPVEEMASAEKENAVEDGLSELMFTETKQETVAEEIPEREAVEQPAENFDSLLFTGEEEKKAEPIKSALFEQIEREYAAEQALLEAQAPQSAPEDNMSDLLIDDSGEFTLKEIEPEVDDGSSDVTEFHDDSNDGEDIEIDEIESTVNVPTVTTGHPQLEAEETPLEEDGSVPLINPNSHREERQVSAVDGPDAVQPLELAASITHEDLEALPDIELPPGYASSENMERDVPETIGPPPYTPTYDYSSYEKIKFRTSSNLFMGIIGTLVLGLIGVAVWVVLGTFLNTISYIGSLAIVISVYGGYYLAGRVLDKKGIVVSFIMSFVMTLLGVFVVLAISMTEALSDTYHTEATLMDGINWIMYFIESGEGMGEFGVNVGISLLITLIADVIFAVKSWRNS